MSRWTGLALMAAGLGGAAIVYPLLPSDAPQAPDVVVARPSALPMTPSARVKDATRSIAIEPSTSRPSLVLQPRTPDTVVVAAAPTPTPGVVAKPIEAPQPTIKATRGDDGRVVLARDIQRELSRVGCFKGTIDGIWSPETRQAMKAFIDRVNASLPIDEPDHILKTLVQGHPGSACGQSCPSGQNLSNEGRCLPTAIMAQVPKRAPAPRDLAPGTPPATVSALTPPLSGSPPSAPTRGWEPMVTGSAPIRQNNPPVTTPLAPLPGRMAAGGPVPAATPPTVAPPTAAIQLAPRQPAAAEAPRPTAALLPPTPSVAEPPPAAAELSRPGVRRAAVPRRPAPTYAGPRFYTAYAQPRSYYAPRRPRFGPQVFRAMERDAR